LRIRKSYFLYYFRFGSTRLIETDGCLDSCGSSGTNETPQAKPRRLITLPWKAKYPEVEINRQNDQNYSILFFHVFKKQAFHRKSPHTYYPFSWISKPSHFPSLIKIGEFSLEDGEVPL
jgi:hypothetical protein